MKIETTYYGEIDIDESKIIQFDKGLLGFQEDKEFVLLDIEGNPHFHLLQSISDKGLSFVVTNPYLIYKNYEFDLDETTVDQLKINEPTDIIVLAILTLHTPFEASTINLKAPIIVNAKKNIGTQIIVNEEYNTKHPIQSKEQGGE